MGGGDSGAAQGPHGSTSVTHAKAPLDSFVIVCKLGSGSAGSPRFPELEADKDVCSLSSCKAEGH